MKSFAKAYIFDMDGTLVDSVYALETTTKSFLDSLSVKYPENIVEIITPLGYTGAAEYIRTLGVDMPTEELTEVMKEGMLKEYENNIPLKPHAKGVLEELHRNGCTLAVLTASPHFLTDPCLKRLGVDKLFKFIWSTDDFGLTKSDEKIYHEAAKLIGEDISDCIFVDDNIINIRTAKESGIGTVAVYDLTSKNSAEEMKKIADKYIYDFSEF